MQMWRCWGFWGPRWEEKYWNLYEILKHAHPGVRKGHACLGKGVWRWLFQTSIRIQVLEWIWWNKLHLICLSGWQVTFKWAGQAVLCCICRTTPVYEVERREAILPSEDDFLFNVSPVCDLILWKFTLLATDEHVTWELRIARQLLLGQPLPLLSLVHSQNGCYQLVEGLICIIICNNELWTSYLLRNAWEIQRRYPCSQVEAKVKEKYVISYLKLAIYMTSQPPR